MPLYWRTIIQIRHMMFVGLVCCDFGGGRGDAYMHISVTSSVMRLNILLQKH